MLKAIQEKKVKPKTDSLFQREAFINMVKERVNSRKSINVVLFSRHKLFNEALKLLIESKSEIKIRRVIKLQKNLIKIASESKPDIILFGVSNKDTNCISTLEKLFEVSPSSKVIIIVDENNSLDQRAIIKTGVTGIFVTNQREESLIRAIRQVSEGEVWFSQKLIANLLENENNGNGNKSQNGSIKYQHLTDREYDVIESIAMGLSNKDISKKLLISEATVRHHLSSIYSKLYVEDRLNLVIYAYQNNIVSLSENEDR